MEVDSLPLPPEPTVMPTSNWPPFPGGGTSAEGEKESVSFSGGPKSLSSDCEPKSPFGLPLPHPFSPIKSTVREGGGKSRLYVSVYDAG